MKKFSVLFSKEVKLFLKSINPKASKKVQINIEKASYSLDPKLLKKLNNDVWEFRTKYDKLQYRLLAFWDKVDGQDVLVIVSHGFIKKTNKVPQSEINKCLNFRKRYFEQKDRK